MKKLFIMFVLILSILNGNIENAKKAYYAKNFKKALPMFEKLSKEGNVESNYYLGTMYAFAYGAKQNYSRAFKYYTISANNPNKKRLKSIFNVGYMYMQGKGVKINYKKAFKIFKTLELEDMGMAQLMIGIMYTNGYGVEENQTKAVSYYLKGCDSKKANSIACYYAGDHYERGIGVEESYSFAKTYYKKGCELGSHEACEALKNMKEPLSFYQKYVNFIRTPEYHIFMIILLAVGLWRLWRKKKREGLLNEKQNTPK